MAVLGTSPGTSSSYDERLETKYISKNQFVVFQMSFDEIFKFFHEIKLFIRFFKEINQKNQKSVTLHAKH